MNLLFMSKYEMRMLEQTVHRQLKRKQQLSSQKFTILDYFRIPEFKSSIVKDAKRGMICSRRRIFRVIPLLCRCAVI